MYVYTFRVCICYVCMCAYVHMCMCVLPVQVLCNDNGAPLAHNSLFQVNMQRTDVFSLDA